MCTFLNERAGYGRPYLQHLPIRCIRRPQQTGLLYCVRMSGREIGGVVQCGGECLQLMPHWNFWPQTLQSRVPTPAFLSSFTVTDFSWLQKRHVKTLGRGSFCVVQSVRPPIIVVVRFGQRHLPASGLAACAYSSCACPSLVLRRSPDGAIKVRKNPVCDHDFAGRRCLRVVLSW